MALKIKIHERLNESFNPKTVKIGNQVWMAENLAVDDGGEGIFKNEANGEYYYTWDAAMRIAKAIQGWHLPSTVEWKTARKTCGDTLGEVLNISLIGTYNFHEFRNMGSDTHVWSSIYTASYKAYAHYFERGYNMNNLTSIICGCPVRLIKD